MPTTVKKKALDKGRAFLRIEERRIVIEGKPLRISSGTNDRKLFDAYKAMCHQLYANPDHHHYLVKLQNRDMMIPEVYALFSKQELEKAEALPHGSNDIENLVLSDFLKIWIANWNKANKTIEGYQERFDVLLNGRGRILIGHLPNLVFNYRRVCERNETFTAFRLMRTAVLSFLGDLFGLLHQSMPEDETPAKRRIREDGEQLEREVIQTLKARIMAVELFDKNNEVLPSRRIPPSITAKDVLRMLPKFSPKYQKVVWQCFTLGLRPTEWTGSEGTVIEEHDDYIKITEHAKNYWSRREIPKIVPLDQPHVHDRSFAQVLKKVTDGQWQPRDLRRAYRMLLAEPSLQIPEYRQRHYLGHGVRDSDDIYLKVNIEPYLKRDAEAIREYLKSQHA